jgi:hypothetical protein
MDNVTDRIFVKGIGRGSRAIAKDCGNEISCSPDNASFSGQPEVAAAIHLSGGKASSSCAYFGEHVVLPEGYAFSGDSFGEYIWCCAGVSTGRATEEGVWREIYGE